MEIPAFKKTKEIFFVWRNVFIFAVFLFAFFAVAVIPARAAIRDTLTYQGKILDASLLPPVDGNYNMQFTIYDSLAAGNLLWTETWNGGNQVAISDGVFTVELNNICASWTGACASNGGVNWSTDSLYLQIGFDADGNGSFEETFAPRKRFTAVPYAQMAARLETASNILFTDNTDHSLAWNQAADRTLTVENTNATNVANLAVEGQVRVGQFAAAPTALGNGALYYNTGDHNLYLYQNSAWQIVGGGGGSGDAIWDADTDTGVQTEESADEDKIRFDIGNASGTAYPDILVLDGTNGFVWNDSGAAALDFRIEGDTNENLLLADAGLDRVGIGTDSPLAALLTLGPGGHESSVFSVAGSTSYTHIFNVRDSNGENIFQFNGTVAANNLELMFGDMDEAGNGSWFKVESGLEKFTFNNGDAIFNEAGGDYDFRIEGDTNANLVFVDASADKIGLGTNAPDFLLDLISGMQIGNATDTDQDLITVDNGDSLANRPSMNYAKDIFFSGLDGFVFNNPNGSNTMMANSVDSYAYMLANSQNNAREVEFLASHNTDPTTYTNLYAHAFGLMPTTQYPYLAYQRGATSRHYLDVIISGTNITDIVFNDSSYDANFRIEGNGNANLFYLDAGTDRVALGNNSPNAFLDISSNIASALRLNPYGAVAGNSAELQFMELVANGSNYVGFKAPDSITTSLAWVLPNVDGSSGAVLKTDGAGNLGWTTSLKSLWDGDTDTGIQVEESADDDTIRFDLGTTAADALKMTQTAGFVWNDSGLDTLDVRMESDTDANLFFLDAGNNNIGIGEAAPDTNAKLEVAGNVMMDDYLYFQNTTTDYLRFDGSNFILSNDLLPSASSTYNLGSSTARWDKAYLGGNSLHIGVDTNDYDISYDTALASLVFNEAGENTDFRLEGDTDANLFYVDAGNNRVGVGTDSALVSLFTVGPGTHESSTFSVQASAAYTHIFNVMDVNESSVMQVNGNIAANTLELLFGDIDGVGTGTWLSVAASDEKFIFNNGDVIFNEAGNDYNLRVEGDTNLNLFYVDASQDSVAVGTNAISGSAVFQIDSTSKGALLPRMTNVQMTGIGTPATGLLVYDTTNNKLAYWNGAAWSSFASEGYVTLDNAYNGGRTITVDAGAIQMNGSNAADETLEVSNTANGGGILVTNSGTGTGLLIDNNNASSIGLRIDSESTGTGAISITHQGDTTNSTGAGIQVTAENGAGGLYIYRNQAAATTDDALVEIFEDNTSDQNVLDVTNDGTGLAFYANQTNTGTTTDAAAILNSGDSNALHLAESSTTANTTGTGAALYIAGTTASTAGDANGIADARNGYGLYLNSEESTGTNKLLGIESDNTTGGKLADTEAFYVRADGVTKVYEGNVAPDFNEDGEFGFYTRGGTRRLYFESNGTRTYINRSGTGDYSEYFRITDPTLKRDWGTVVVMDVSGSDMAVARSLLFKDKNVLGVVSEFGTRNNDDEEGMRHEDFNWANIAMLGQVPVKVTNQNGPIAVGDYLTSSSVIGHAMKADSGDPILGIAMEAFSGTVQSSEGMVDCLLSRNNQGNIATLLQDLQERQTLTAEDVLAVINNESLALNYLVMTKGEVMEGLKVHGELELDSQNIGSTVVLAGEQRVRVYFPENFRVKPIVTVSPELTTDNEIFFDFQYLLYDVNADGFSIKLNQPLDYDLRFNWQAFAQADYSNDFEIDIPDSTPVNNIQPLVSFDCRADNLSACVTARDCWQFADIAKWTGSSCVLK